MFDALLGAIVIVRIRGQDDQTAIERNRAEPDVEPQTFLVGEGSADFGPALAGFAVALVFLDGVDVQVGRGRSGQRLLNGAGRLWIAIVHRRYSLFKCLDFHRPVVPSDGREDGSVEAADGNRSWNK